MLLFGVWRKYGMWALDLLQKPIYEAPHRTEFVTGSPHDAGDAITTSGLVSTLSSTVSESRGRQSPPPRDASLSSETLGCATRAALCVPLGEGVALGPDEAGEANYRRENLLRSLPGAVKRAWISWICRLEGQSWDKGFASVLLTLNWFCASFQSFVIEGDLGEIIVHYCEALLSGNAKSIPVFF